MVTAGSWSVWLTVDNQSRFPDALSVIPKSSRLSKAFLDEGDVADILRAMQGAVKDDQERTTVTVNFAAQPSFRVGSDSEVTLPRSSGSGPLLALTIDGRYLERALSLGLREIRAAASQDGVHFRDGNRSYVVARLHDGVSAVRTSPAETEDETSEIQYTASENGHSTMRRETAPETEVERPVEEPLDVLAEAEALRTALTEVGRRIGRLIAGLRGFQKQRRALQSAWNSLRNLQLTSVEEP